VKADLKELSEQYATALRQYCAAGAEAALLQAYQLGRHAVLSGLGVLEVSGLHQEALLDILRDRASPAEHARVARRASEFLAESLAPFELTRRGIAEAHAALADLNYGLTQRLRAALQAIAAAQKQLLEQRKVAQVRSDVIGVVSHELRTPLTSIHGALDLLKAGVGGELNDRGQHLVEVAFRNSQRLVRLVSDVLDLQRLESGTMTFKMRPTALRVLLEHAVEANQAYAARFGVTLAVKTVPNGARVRVDGDQLMQVMANLLSNAVKFSARGDTVAIEAERREGLLRVAITDHGPGVPAEFRARIFQKFAQAAVPSEQKGSGLGLSITKAILETMGGQIDFTSEPGHTTFFFDLPEWKPRAVEEKGAGRDTVAVGN
jgi:signal transduction histidine kinase